jgi:hypothetical protein
MAKTLFMASAPELWNAGVGPFYFPPGFPRFLSDTVEADAQVTVRAAGTWSGMTARVNSNSLTATTTFTSRVGGADGNQAVSFASSTSGAATDSTNHDTLSDGNLINYKVTVGGTGSNITPVSLTAAFAASSGTHALFCSFGGQAGGGTAFTGTDYWTLNGDASTAGNTTEANVQERIHNGCTLSHLFIYASANGTGTRTIKSRVAGADGNQVLSITTGATGFFEDTSNSDSISADALCNYSTATSTFAQQTTIKNIGTWVSLTDVYCDIFAGRNADFSYSASTGYMAVAGYMASSVNGAEANAQARIPYAASWNRMRVRVRANTLTGTTTVTSRVGAADGVQSLSITTTSTGSFEDTTHIDTLTTSSDIDIKFTGGTSGTLSVREFSNQIKDTAVITRKRRVQVLAK